MSVVVESVRFLDGEFGHTQKIKKAMYEAARQFVYIGFLLYEVDSYGYYREHGHKDVYEYAALELNLKKTTVKNLIAINYTFGCRDGRPAGIAHERTMALQAAYEDFNYSQLTEMLSMSEKQRSQVTPDMSVRQIRELKKVSAPASEPEFPLHPQYETIPMELPEQHPAPESAGQTSDQDLICLSLSGEDARFILRLIQEDKEYYLEPGFSDYDRATALIVELNRLGVF